VILNQSNSFCLILLIHILINLISRNVFLTDENIKLGDFGSAKSIRNSIARTFTGTAGYMSPEMIRKYFHNAELILDEKTDIWYIYIILKKNL
jgi:serine/threonine protein kinase